MSTRFKNTSSGVWTDFKTIGTVWKFDTVGVTPKVLEGTLEELTMSGVCQGPHRSGDIVCLLEEFTSNLHAISETPDNTGAVDSTFEQLECTMSGTFIENYVEAVFENLIMEGYANMGLECNLEFFSCEMQSLFGASIEATFEEIDLIAQGDATFVELYPLIEKLEIEMFSGVSIEIETEEITMSGHSFIETKGSIDSRLQRLIFEASSGHGIIASFEQIGMIGEANTPVLGTLNIRTENYTCSMLATTESVNSLLVRLRQLTSRINATQINPGEETTLLGTLKRLGATLTGINGPIADLEFEFMEFEAELIGSTATETILEGTFEDLTMHAISFTGLGVETECEPFETLKFGVVA